MSTFLFDKAVFGPVHSRRLGCSLGINLLPADRKVCSFDCLYCECGFTGHGEAGSPLPTRRRVAEDLEAALVSMTAGRRLPDVITFAGNGEPTLHPHFAEIIDDTIALRDRYAPQARICVLTNATRLENDDVAAALCRTDEAILKIDSGLEDTIARLDRPHGRYSLEHIVECIIGIKERMGNALTIQTMFVRWSECGVSYDNSGEADLQPWLDIIGRIAPPRLMIYTIERDTPHQSMSKTPPEVLDAIAARVRPLVKEVSVSY